MRIKLILKRKKLFGGLKVIFRDFPRQVGSPDKEHNVMASTSIDMFRTNLSFLNLCSVLIATDPKTSASRTQIKAN